MEDALWTTACATPTGTDSTSVTGLTRWTSEVPRASATNLSDAGVRYALYLRPPFTMCSAVYQIHRLLERQYGLLAASRFMPHATIKGFFRTETHPDALREMLDDVFEERAGFSVYNNGIMAPNNDAVVLNLHHTPTGTRNEAIQRLHEDVVRTIEPVLHARYDSGIRKLPVDAYLAHISLASRDLPAGLVDEVFQFIHQAGPIGPPSFRAEVFHLFAFKSSNWDGAWWESLRWRLLHSWTLPARNDAGSLTDPDRRPATGQPSTRTSPSTPGAEKCHSPRGATIEDRSERVSTNGRSYVEPR